MRQALTMWIARAAAGVLLGLACVASAQAADAKGGSDGVWRSRGYGIVAEVRGGRATYYDVTRAACLKRPNEPELSTALFDGAKVSPRGDQLTVQSSWALTMLTFDRLDGLPASCAKAPANPKDPVANFEVFWNTFNEHYAFFRERGVDWNEVGATYRAQINGQTTDAELLEIFRKIFRQLQDDHVGLIAGRERVNAGYPSVLTRLGEAMSKRPASDHTSGAAALLKSSWDRYLDPGSIELLGKHAAVGSAAKGAIGYAMISAEEGEAADIDALFARFAGKRGLILDMRLNSGGDDRLGLALAGSLTAQVRPGFSKCARDGDGFTPVQRTTVQPRPKAFSGPVVVLISPLNWSAGENFAMTIKDFPNVVVVGDRTGGVHSDTLIKYLPNGWRFTLSNEVFTAPDGTTYETVGVPPDLLVPYDPEANLADGVDPQIEKALYLLGSDRFAELAAGAKRLPGRGRRSPCV